MNGQFEQALEAFQSGDLKRARALAEEAVLSAPSARAQHLLGLVHCRLGKPADGVPHLRAAAEAESGNPAFGIMLMRALVDSGRPAEVLDLPEPPPIHSAAALELWRARGEAASAAGEHQSAIAAWSKVAAAAPRDWRASANLGRALSAQSRWSEAIDPLRKAVALNPAEASLHWSLGAALAAIDRHEEALAELDSFEAIAGRTADSALSRGRCALALLRLDEAEQSLRHAVALAPANADAVRELGLLLERTNRSDELPGLIEGARAAGVADERLGDLEIVRAFRSGRAEDAYRLLKSAGPEADPLGWHRVMAKVADRLGLFAEAFASAEAMNQLTPGSEVWRERGAAYRKDLRGLGQSLSQIRTLPRLSQSKRRSPAFLVGFPRSGTTLLDTFLLGHPDVEVMEEVRLLDAAADEIGGMEGLGRASPERLAQARRAYFNEVDRYVERRFEGLLVDKLPLNLLGAPLMEAMFPGAPIIFAQRHPCDSVLSGFMQSFVMNDAMASFLTIEDAADLYDAVMSGWRAIVEAIPLNVQSVRYERLVEDPESELRPLVDFLGLEWDDQMLAHTDTAKKRGVIITPSYDQVTEPLSSKSVGRWKQYREQLEPVLGVLLPWAEWLGYSD